MSRRFIFICDGCDKRVETASQSRPQGWADLSINASGYTNWYSGGSPQQEVETLLCGSCQLVIRERIDPRGWPRCAGAENQP